MDINDRVEEIRNRRLAIPGSIAAMEALDEAESINWDVTVLEDLTARLAASWDGELDAIGAYGQLDYLFEKASRIEAAAGRIRESVERLFGDHYK